MRAGLVIETSLFSRQRDALLTDDEFAALPVRLAEDPEAGTSLGGALFKLRLGLAGAAAAAGCAWSTAGGAATAWSSYSPSTQRTRKPT